MVTEQRKNSIKSTISYTARLLSVWHAEYMRDDIYGNEEDEAKKKYEQYNAEYNNLLKEFFDGDWNKIYKYSSNDGSTVERFLSENWGVIIKWMYVILMLLNKNKQF